MKTPIDVGIIRHGLIVIDRRGTKEDYIVALDGIESMMIRRNVMRTRSRKRVGMARRAMILGQGGGGIREDGV